ncbi:SDR family oxidoreductase [Rubinisphaera margarita]|uniref:SDR family oxidoreductase n=1 Tax=Rubinisphaera margarita TaxID=2909586 RepID=UPI001EE96749|nr:SDR family oxidoreductase [Rubinisphaera margarita]MCG6156460.1 SDR family oxidoreductase [Rubinisphaera margarita]
MANKSKSRGASEGEQRPAQSQARQPGRQHKMEPEPVVVREDYQGSSKLKGKVALITGGDSGIGRSAAVMFAREGADVAIVYLEEQQDAEKTAKMIEQEGQSSLLIKGDIGEKAFCQKAVEETISKFGQLDVLVNNAAEQHEAKEIDAISEEQLVQTFRTNIFSMFFLTQAALPHLRKQKGSTIINTTSVTAYRGSPGLLDYSSTKGAIVAFTRSLSQKLAAEGIRVNAVAPGPIWTPLIPASFDAEKVSKFGGDSPLGRAGQPSEVGTCYVFLASDDSSYMTGQVLHPNGGEVING